MPMVMVGVGSNLKSQSFLSHPHRGVGLLGHGQIPFVSFKGVGTLGTNASLGGTVQGVLCAIQKYSSDEPVSRCKSMSSNHGNVTLLTAGGRIACLQCKAKSKRTGIQCRAPAAKGKPKCRFHGGASTGPKTEQGRQRCADAKTIHGNETRKARTERAAGMRRLRALEVLGYALGIMTGEKTSGKKPSLS
jgi:hypothetical protein